MEQPNIPESNQPTYGRAVSGFVRNLFSDVLGSVLIYILCGFAVVGTVSVSLGVPFVSALGLCALLAMAGAALGLFSNF